ncbi:MAG TPA: DNA repair protein RecN [Methylovirgula sp.]|nr:DNA repair protein RecN [Methylovirgula sp.]
MLVQLAIRDIVLIDKLDLEFGRGLTVLTGETGAGKSILLDAFALSLGGRGDGSLVRQGEPQGQVTAVFDLPLDHPAIAAARAQDIETEGELILRRLQMADGRTRAFVNDQPVSAQALRGIARELVEIHGQHDDRALINSDVHRQLIDAYGGLGPQCGRVRSAFGQLRAAQAELAAEQKRLEKAQAEADYLRHAHQELVALAPKPEEEAACATRRAEMMQAEKVSAELRDAAEAVGGEGAPLAAMSSTLRRLERRQAQAPDLIGPILLALDTALTAFHNAIEALDAALRAANYDAGELERVEERLFALRAASRKYSVAVDDLPALAERIAADLAALDAGEMRLESLRETAKAAQAAYDSAATDLSAARKRAARDLERAVNAELPPLKLEGAEFTVKFHKESAAPGPDGIDQVEFWVKTNPGTKPGPLGKIASGGELARFMLALKVALADRGSAPTLVFDEIDAGVGGAVADAIGQRLARLAADVQVLAVTHAPQVAAQAFGHFRIVKDALEKGARVATRVTHLAKEARREEIARMLAGATITEEARAAAGRLLERTG